MMTAHRNALCAHSRTLTPLIALVLACGLTVGCSEQGSAATDADAPLLVRVSNTGITVENRAETALTDVAVTLVSRAGPEFAKTLPRLEHAQEQFIPLNEFVNADGSSFNPLFARARAVRVGAADLTGERYELEVPWR